MIRLQFKIKFNKIEITSYFVVRNVILYQNDKQKAFWKLKKLHNYAALIIVIREIILMIMRKMTLITVIIILTITIIIIVEIVIIIQIAVHSQMVQERLSTHFLSHFLSLQTTNFNNISNILGYKRLKNSSKMKLGDPCS